MAEEVQASKAGAVVEPFGENVRNITGSGPGTGAASCPAREGVEKERKRGRQRRLDSYCVVWCSTDGDCRFNQYVAATSVREAERRSKEDIQLALGLNAHYWQISDIRGEAPTQARHPTTSNLFRRMSDRFRRTGRLLMSKFSGF